MVEALRANGLALFLVVTLLVVGLVVRWKRFEETRRSRPKHRLANPAAKPVKKKGG